MENIVYKKLQPIECDDTFEVLHSCGLPYSDIEPSKGILFFVAKDGDKVIGTIGLETYGKDGLLRSFGVLPVYRNKEIGNRLLTQMLQAAKVSGIETLHLLTTTAEAYFLRRGFSKADRAVAPLTIKTTSEFSALCPSTSAYMLLDIKKSNF